MQNVPVAAKTAAQLPAQETMLVIVYPRDQEEMVLKAMRDAGVPGYTFSGGWHGAGHSGPVLGSAVWPGQNDVALAAVTPEQTDQIVSAIRALHDHRRAVLPGTGMAVFSFPCTQLL
jgi:FAD/FMN-containing dehydrogenase